MKIRYIVLLDLLIVTLTLLPWAYFCWFVHLSLVFVVQICLLCLLFICVSCVCCSNISLVFFVHICLLCLLFMCVSCVCCSCKLFTQGLSFWGPGVKVEKIIKFLWTWFWTRKFSVKVQDYRGFAIGVKNTIFEN